MLNPCVIVSIVRKGWGDTVLEATMQAGAHGGTVLFGRGIGRNEQQKVFGIKIEPEKEIVTYRSEAELVDKTRHYLAHPAQAESVREAGYRRALRDHTWINRFKQLFAAVGLKQ